LQERNQNRPSDADKPANAGGANFYDHYADIERAKQQMEQEEIRNSDPADK